MFVQTGAEIEVKTQFEGIHCWPEAPDAVAFLRHPHRHMFHVTLRMPVKHNNRDLEFILVKRWLDDAIRGLFSHDPDGVCNLGRFSCEDIAVAIAGRARIVYNCPATDILVSEDGENGAWMHWREPD